VITPEQGQQHLVRIVATINELLVTADFAAPVPSCPGWTVADLIVHLGETHLWARHAIVAGNPEAPDPEAPSDHEALPGWYRGAADALLGTLRSVDPAAPAWTFGLPPRTAAFWSRRQAHEASMHGWDLATAVGHDIGYDEELALDGIDEVVTMFFPRQVRLGRMPPLPAGLGIRPDGSTARWTLAVDGRHHPDEPADAVLAGPAPILLLLLWGRVGLDDPRLRLTGDREAARAVLDAPLAP
jgi:uncharacterized protein (TIGR03083 family)